MDITVQELKQKLDAGEKFVFIDVREPWEYEEFNLGAQLMPVGDLMNTIWQLEEHKNDEIIVHCRSGARSGMAQAMMQAQGFINVRNLTGGAMAWKEAGFLIIVFTTFTHKQMPNSSEKSARFYSFIQSPEKLIADIQAKVPESLPTERLPMGDDIEALQARLDFLTEKGHNFSYLTGKQAFTDHESLHGNIENYIGMSMVPTGIIGPLNILGTSARGDFYVPLATSEGALVASYDRGARATRRAGGITSICLAEGVQRSPVFKFRSIGEVGVFVQWVLGQEDEFRMIIGRTSNYAQLSEFKMTIEGNHLILTFEYLTGDAAGQNMVTLCTDAICQYIVANSPQKPEYWFVEGNYSGDKKATALSFTNLRGKKVTAEVLLPRGIVESVLRTTPRNMANYWRSSTCGVIQSGAIGAQGHVANGLCALFIATGQDAACTAEAAVGITRMELMDDGLYASVTLPNLIVGTVGGGTSLPTQRECLELIDCYGSGKARKFSEICAAVALAGEVSIAAALSAGHFSAAHQKFGRKKK